MHKKFGFIMVLGRMFWKKSGKAKEVSVKNFMTRLHWRLRKYRIREGRNIKELLQDEWISNLNQRMFRRRSHKVFSQPFRPCRLPADL